MLPQVTFGRRTAEWSFADLNVTRTRHAAGLRLPVHDHAPATLAVVLDGEFRETVGRQTFPCCRGAVLLKPAGAHHSNAYGAASTALLVTLPPRLAPREVGFVRGVDAAVLASRLQRELARGDAAAALVAEGLLLELMGMALRRAGQASRQAPPWLATALERLREGDPLSLLALANEVKRHPAHVAREFRRHVGCSVGEYHRNVRLDRAGEALRSTDAALADIAIGAGFCDQSHFTHAFRRRFGMPPGSYRTSFATTQRRSKT